MKTQYENGSFARQIVRSVAIGTAVGAVASVTILLVMAAVMAAGVFPSRADTLLATIAAVVGAFVGGLFAARAAGGKGLLYGAVVGLVLFLLTAVAGFSLIEDAVGKQMLLKLALMLVGGCAGGVVGVNLRRR